MHIMSTPNSLRSFNFPSIFAPPDLLFPHLWGLEDNYSQASSIVSSTSILSSSSSSSSSLSSWTSTLSSMCHNTVASSPHMHSPSTTHVPNLSSAKRSSAFHPLPVNLSTEMSILGKRHFPLNDTESLFKNSPPYDRNFLQEHYANYDQLNHYESQIPTKMYLTDDVDNFCGITSNDKTRDKRNNISMFNFNSHMNTEQKYLKLMKENDSNITTTAATNISYMNINDNCNNKNYKHEKTSSKFTKQTKKWNKYSISNDKDTNNSKYFEKAHQTNESQLDTIQIDINVDDKGGDFNENDNVRHKRSRRINEQPPVVEDENDYDDDEDDDDEEEVHDEHLEEYETEINSKNGQNMECVVCGDKSSGKHYGQHTCEGCKSFFKRSVRRKLNYTCRGNRQCPIDIHHRNQCQYCRFQKCIKVGMRKEAVQQGRLPPFPLLYHPYFGLSNFFSSNVLPPMRNSVGPSATQIINMLLLAEHKSHQYLDNEYLTRHLHFILHRSKIASSLSSSSCSSSSSSSPPSPVVTETPKSSCVNVISNYINETDSLSQAFNLSTHNNISSSGNPTLRISSPYSLACLTSNSKSSTLTSTPQSVGKSLSGEEKSLKQNMKSSQKSTVLSEITNSTLTYLIVMIEWAKNIPLFSELQPSDQLILFTNSWPELFMLYLAQTYNSTGIPSSSNRTATTTTNDDSIQSPSGGKLGKNCTVHSSSIKTNHSVDDLLLAKSKCPEIVNYKQVNSDEQFKPTLEHLKDMTSSLSGHQDYSACFQDQLERLQQLHLDQSEYVCLKALILFSSEAPGLKDPVIIDSIQERIQCALEEYDKYHYSHYQPFRFGRLLLRLPRLKQTVYSPSSLLWLQHSFFPSLDYSHKGLEALVREIFANASSFQALHSNKCNPIFGQNYMSYQNVTTQHPFLQPTVPCPNLQPPSLFPLPMSRTLSPQKSDKASFILSPPRIDYLTKYPTSVVSMKDLLSRHLLPTCNLNSCLYSNGNIGYNDPFHQINTSVRRSMCLSDSVKATPHGSSSSEKSKSLTRSSDSIFNENSSEIFPVDGATYNNMNVKLSETSPTLSPSSKLSSSSTSVNSIQTHLKTDLNKASDGSKTAVNSMSPNNIEHNEPESEIYQIQKNLDNCSKLITDNLLNSNSLFSDLWNLMPNTDRNSNLHLYFSLVRHHLNLMQNQTS